MRLCAGELDGIWKKVLKGIITWPDLGKQNKQARKVYYAKGRFPCFAETNIPMQRQSVM